MKRIAHALRIRLDHLRGYEHPFAECSCRPGRTDPWD